MRHCVIDCLGYIRYEAPGAAQDHAPGIHFVPDTPADRAFLSPANLGKEHKGKKARIQHRPPLGPSTRLAPRLPSLPGHCRPFLLHPAIDIFPRHIFPRRHLTGFDRPISPSDLSSPKVLYQAPSPRFSAVLGRVETSLLPRRTIPTLPPQGSCVMVGSLSSKWPASLRSDEF